MSLPSERIKPFDLGQALATAYMIRNAKQRNEMGELELSQQRYAFDNQRQFQDAIGRQDFEAARRINPTAMAALEQKQLEQRKTSLEMQKDAAKLTYDRDTESRGLQQRLLAAAKAGADIGKLRKVRDSAVQRGYSHFELPGDGDAFADVVPDAPEQTQQQITALERQAGVDDPYAKPTGEMVEYRFAKDNPGFDERAIALRRAGATTINNNMKDLPAGQVSELADYNTAIEALDSLQTKFKNLVPSEDTIDQIMSRAESVIPNTSPAQYKDAVLAAQQVVGTILEKGKLVGADEAKYRSMMPKPGDSFETVRLKVQNIKELLYSQGRNRGLALRETGYRTPTMNDGSQGPQGGGQSEAQQIAKRTAELKKVPGMTRERALEIMRQEGFQIGGPQ